MPSNEHVAAERFTRGFNCAQAVFSAYATAVGLMEEDALRIGAGFGGGMGGQQEVCGAVTGAYMVIGVRCGMVDLANIEAKEKTNAMVNEFATKFRALHGSTICLDLLGCDMNIEEGKKEIAEKNLSTAICLPCVQDACRILDALAFAENDQHS